MVKFRAARTRARHSLDRPWRATVTAQIRQIPQNRVLLNCRPPHQRIFFEVLQFLKFPQNRSRRSVHICVNYKYEQLQANITHDQTQCFSCPFAHYYSSDFPSVSFVSLFQRFTFHDKNKQLFKIADALPKAFPAPPPVFGLCRACCV
jgi:hypothetical protein